MVGPGGANRGGDNYGGYILCLGGRMNRHVSAAAAGSSSSSWPAMGNEKETHNLDCASHSILYGCICIMCLFVLFLASAQLPTPERYPSK